MQILNYVVIIVITIILFIGFVRMFINNIKDLYKTIAKKDINYNILIDILTDLKLKQLQN